MNAKQFERQVYILMETGRQEDAATMLRELTTDGLLTVTEVADIRESVFADYNVVLEAA